MGSEPRGHRRRWLPTLFGLALVVGMVVLATKIGDPRRYAELLKDAEPRWLVPAAVLQGCTYFCTGGVYVRVLKRAGHRERLLDMVGLGLAKQFTDQAVPTGGVGGSVVVARGLEKRGVDEPTAAAAVLVDVIAHYGVIALLVLLAVGFLRVHRDLETVVVVGSALFVGAAIAIPAFVLWLNARGAEHLPRLLAKLPGIRKAAAAIAEAPQELLRSRGLLAQVALLEALLFALDAVSLGLVLLAVGAKVKPAVAFAAYTLAYLTETVGIVPGGLGTFEAACVAVLTWLGTGFEGAVTGTLLLRLMTFWAPLIPGALLARKELAA
jgi:uncharacterized protein (TIRG00374 family)